MNGGRSYLTFWGKSDRVEGGQWHPVAFHLLDVAACAEQIVVRNPRRFQDLAQRYGTASDDLARAMVALVGVHDLAKFSRAFQVKAPWLWPEAALGRIPTEEQRPLGRHDADLLHWLKQRFGHAASPLNVLSWPMFEKWSGADWRDVAEVMGAIAGHHGEPVDDDGHLDMARIFGSGSEQAAADFLADWFDLIEAPSLPFFGEEDARAFAWRLVGLTVVSDWLGSGRDHFPLRHGCGATVDMPLALYWEDVARPGARRAIDLAGLARISPSAHSNVSALTGISEPRPLQRVAENLELPEGPLLVIVEDVTGSGKTEAGLVLAHRLLRRMDAGGLYMALPTMATANALFERLESYLANLFDPNDARPSLSLAHGKAWLHPRFRRPALPADESPVAEEPEPVALACAEWIADDRRKAFLAQVGAGTIDQALMAILPARYQSLRLFGLADRVLVIDEAHSYDAYSGELLANLVRFQAALGGSTILLSATLSARERERLKRAFARGRGAQGSLDLLPSGSSDAYPLMTVMSDTHLSHTPVAPVEALRRTVAVERLSDVATAEARLTAAHRSGMAVAYVRNSVQDAIDTADRLRAAGLDPLLFHARFAMGDRLAIEAQVKALYGRGATADARRDRPLVATQVVEQSLDLDFDLMVTDLAPVDLLIQRAGRVWRHMTERPAKTRLNDAPTLLVVSPDPTAQVSENWVKAIFPRGGAVYPDHGLLWRSARALFATGVISAPEDLRRLVELVYTDEPEPWLEIPRALSLSEEKAYGEAMAQRSHARQVALNYEDGYRRTGVWRDDAEISTRLGEPRLTIRLARQEGGAVVPWRADADLRRAWALSEIEVPLRHLTGVPVPDHLEEAVARVRETFGRFDQMMPVCVLEERGEGWRGAGVSGSDAPVTLAYDPGLGLQVLSPG